MLHVHKFQDLCPVALSLQQLGPQPVGNKRRHPLLEYPVGKHWLQRVVGNLPVELVLTAGHRQDNSGLPGHRLGQGIIYGCIAGVEGHHHIYLIHSLIPGNIPLQELQLFITVFFRQPVAIFNYIGLQVQPDHPHIQPLLHLQIVVHGKGEIGFSAAEINDGQLPVPGQLGQHVLDEFQEAVYLTEFIVLGLHDPPLFGHHPQIHQKLHRLSRLKNVLLLPVVGQADGAHQLRLFFLFYLHRELPLLAHQHRSGGAAVLQLQLPVVQDPLLQPTDQLLLVIVFMQLLGAHSPGHLEQQTALDLYRPHPQPAGLGFSSRPADNNLQKPLVQISQQKLP